MSKNVETAAQALIDHIMAKFSLTDINQLECPLMRDLAIALRANAKD